MCDQTMPYAVGSWVWCKVSNRVWWPGKVVDRSTVPEDFNEYLLKKKNPIAIVHFERENSYECITSMDKVCLYSCDQKLAFLKKGYLLYEKQLKSGRETENISMANFIEDVLSVEKIIGGDENIFNQFKEKKDQSNNLSKLIKELFVTTKEQKKKNSRKSLPAPKSKTPVSSAKSTSVTRVRTPKPYGPRRFSVDCYKCYSNNDCPFTANRYDALKRHMDLHKTTGLRIIVDKTAITPVSSAKSTSRPRVKATRSSASTSKSVPVTKKRSYTKNKKPANKKIKLDEILKDWDDGDEESMNDSDVQNTGAEVSETVTSVDSSTDVQIDVIEKDHNNVNEEQLPSVSNFDSIGHESGNESDADITLDRLNESSESTKIINDQNSTNSFTEIAASTSDQISNGNKSDATTTIMKCKVIGNDDNKSEGSESSNKRINDKTTPDDATATVIDDDGDDKSKSSESSNKRINDETTSDGKNTDTEKTPNEEWETTPAQRLFDSIPEPEWMIRENWKARVPFAVEEARRVLAMGFDPFDKSKIPQRVRKPILFETELPDPEPIIEVQPSPIRRKMWVEVKEPPEKLYTEEELRQIPEIKNILKKARLGQPHGAYITIEGAKFVPEKPGRSMNENNE